MTVLLTIMLILLHVVGSGGMSDWNSILNAMIPLHSVHIHVYTSVHVHEYMYMYDLFSSFSFLELYTYNTVNIFSVWKMCEI